jgi:hypothetical protein
MRWSGCWPADLRLDAVPIRRTVVLAVTLVLAGCGLAPTGGDPIIDTWPVGPPYQCEDLKRCEEQIAAGLEGLAVRNPGHAPVAAARLHVEGAYVDPASGNRILVTRSGGCCRVLVVELADGTTRAIGVGYPGISREAVAIPWGP